MFLVVCCSFAPFYRMWKNFFLIGVDVFFFDFYYFKKIEQIRIQTTDLALRRLETLPLNHNTIIFLKKISSEP